MASDFREALTEEIALEGLDGITINALWTRLSDRKNFSFTLDDKSKCYIWNCVLNLKGMEFYELPEPRHDLILFNRFHYIDPETRHFIDIEDAPENIYPVSIVEEEGVLGSCAQYKTRIIITETIKTSKPSLAEVTEKYGNCLVVVASQSIRQKTLIGTENDPDFVFDNISYCILEKIGRSRFNGEASFGNNSLQSFQESAKTLYYMMKKLRHLHLLTKQRLCVVRKPTNVKITCFLYHLNRYYQAVGNRVHDELLNLAVYLSKKPDCMEETSKVKADLKLYEFFKKVTQHTTKNGRAFEFIDIRWRDRYPNSKPHEYMMKNRTEKKIRLICMVTTLEEIEKSLKYGYEKESDDEDEEGAEQSLANIEKEIEFSRVYDEPFLYQMMKVITQAGSKGLSQIGIMKIMGISRLSARRALKMLQKANHITIVLEDRGRQKTMMYVDTEYVKQNEALRSVQKEMQIFQDVVKTETPDIQKSAKSEKTGTEKQPKKSKKSKKEMPVVNLNEKELSEETVIKIREELGRIDDGQQKKVLSPNQLTVKQEIIKEIQAESGVHVEINEVDVEKVHDKRTGHLLKGMRRFGYMLTESHVRRANWILEVISAIKVVESFIILRLLRHREREMKLNINMDNKSLKRLVDALIEEGRIRSFKAKITMKERSRDFTYLCAPDISKDDEILLRMIDEGKLRYFSVSREELRSRNMQRKAQDKADGYNVNENKDNIPQAALDTIKSHQEYRRKLNEKAPVMKYDRKASQRYGLLPKMLRIHTLHEYLFYLSHDTHGNTIKFSPKNVGGEVQNKTTATTTAGEGETKTGAKDVVKGAEVWKGVDRLDVAEGMTDTIDDEPIVYSNEMTWRRYLPPVPVHAGYPKGWLLLADSLLIMPVSLFCEVVSVCYNIEGLDEILKHPKKRFYPVINLPFSLTQQLLHSKKYVYSFSTLCAYLAEMGLLSFGKEVVKEKDQSYICLHQNAALLDTRESLPGYNKTRKPESHEFAEKKFHFDSLSDLQPYWDYLQIVACNSNLGCKSMVHADLEDEVAHTIRSLKDASAAYGPETLKDDGVLPGDLRGGAGLDSSLFSHTIKNWTNSGCLTPVRNYRRCKSGQGGSNELVENYHTTNLKGRDRLIISDDPKRPIALKKITREVRGNKGGKGISRRAIIGTEVTKTHTIISKMEGKVLKKRCIKLQNLKKKRKKAFEKGDQKDKDIYNERCKMRVVWSLKEDSVLLMCRLATLIMDNRKKITLISYTKVRDYLHEKCGPISSDKTSGAVQRRIKFVLKNPLTETNLLLYYREAMQDENVLKNYVSKEFLLTDEDLVPSFRKLVDYLLDKFKSLDLQKCYLPDNLKELRKNYAVQYIGKLTPRKIYSDVKNKADVCQDVLRNILHSAVLLRDKQGRTHEMFKLLSQYPDPLLSAVVKELRTDGLFVINKKNYQRDSINQLQTGMGLRNFKVSQRYLYQYKHSYLSAMFEEAALLVTRLADHHLHGNKEEEGAEFVTMPYHPKSGECALLIPLILNRWLDFKIEMPEELVIVDMEGFYKFPWGRGKNANTQTKGDKILQTLKGMSNQKKKGGVDGENVKLKKGKKRGAAKRAKKSTDKIDDDDDDDLDSEVESDENSKRGKGKGKTSKTKKTDTEEIVNTDKTSAIKEQSEKLIGEAMDTGKNDTETASEKSNATDAAQKDVNSGYTSVMTNHSTVNFPNIDPIPEHTAEGLPPQGSSLASRTLLSLRRADDSSFDEIRIFNMQDNFVVKSCKIEMKIRDNLEEGKPGSPSVEQFPGSIDEMSNKSERSRVTKTDAEKSEKMETVQKGQEALKKQETLSRLLLSKEKIKNIQAELQRLLPFQLDMEDFWSRLEADGVSNSDLTLYQNVFQVIDQHGDLGIRIFDLSKQFETDYPWKQATEVLIYHSVVFAYDQPSCIYKYLVLVKAVF